MTHARATAEGYLWNHAGKVLEYVLLFVIAVFIARGLGVEANGVYASLVSFAQLLVVLSSLSLESSLNRFIPQLSALDPETRRPRLRFMLRRVFFTRGVLLLLVLLAALLAVSLLEPFMPEGILRYFWVLAGYAVVRSFLPLLGMVFLAQLQTALLARIAVAVRAIELAGIAAMTATGTMTVNSLMVFLACTGALQAAYLLYAGRGDLLGNAEPLPMKPLFAFGALYWINAVMEFFLGRQGDVLFLTMLLQSPVPASMYNVAFTVVLLAAQGLTLGLGGITLTSFSRLAATSPEKMDKFYGFLVRVISLLVVPVLVFVFFNAGSIVVLLFSNAFSGAAPLVQWMVIFRLLGRPFGGAENADYLLAEGRVMDLVRIGITGAAVNVVLDLLLIPGLLTMGAVIGSGCAALTVNILGYLHVRGRRNHEVQWTYWGALITSSIVAGAFSGYLLSGNGWPALLGRGGLFALLTAFLLYVMKPFPAFDGAWVAEVNEKLARVFMHFTHDAPRTIARV